MWPLKQFFLGMISGILIFNSSPAYPNVVRSCTGSYSDIDTVFWTTKSVIPQAITQISWSEVETNISIRLSSIVNDEANITGIKIKKATADAKTTLSEHPNSLFVTVVFSYIPTNAFSTPLSGELSASGLAVWIEEARGSSHKLPRGREVSRIELYPIPANPVEEGNPFIYGTLGLLTEVGCEVIQDNSNRACSNPWGFGMNKMIEKKHVCN
jgi:hypothetical protein